MSEEIYTYYKTIVSVIVSTKGGQDLVLKKQGVCGNWWLKLDTCVNRVGIVCPLLVSCFGSRGLAALVSVGIVL
jgi:hypothetical protein